MLIDGCLFWIIGGEKRGVSVAGSEEAGVPVLAALRRKVCREALVYELNLQFQN